MLLPLVVSRRLMVSLTTRRRKLLLEGVGIFSYSISNHYIMVSRRLMVSLTTRRGKLLLEGVGIFDIHYQITMSLFLGVNDTRRTSYYVLYDRIEDETMNNKQTNKHKNLGQY